MTLGVQLRWRPHPGVLLELDFDGHVRRHAHDVAPELAKIEGRHSDQLAISLRFRRPSSGAQP